MFMEFVLIAHDYKEEKALERRMAVREEHLKNAGKMFEEGKLIFASALLDDNGKMNGSVMFVNFSSEEELKREWLEKEVYVTGGVWEKVEIRKAKVAKH
jgi:uncharacterized protein YciI